MKQSLGQLIGDIGEQTVSLTATKTGLWIARPGIKDYGIDLELELIDSKNLTANFIKIQIKTHKTINIKNGFIKESISKDFLQYAYYCKIPVLLLVVSEETGKIWYIWVQKWIIESNNLENINNNFTKTLTVKIPETNDFIIGLNDDIVKIAKWEDNIQINIILNDLFNLSLSLGNTEITKTILSLLNNSDIKIFDNRLLEFLVNEFSLLGKKTYGTREGNIISELFYDFTRKYGDKYTLKILEKIIFCGDEYLINGITILSIMYDDFFDYTKSLGLTNYLKKMDYDILLYYCTLREKCKDGENYLNLLTNNFTVNNLTINPGNLDEILEKHIYYGDSVILRYLEKVK